MCFPLAARATFSAPETLGGRAELADSAEFAQISHPHGRRAILILHNSGTTAAADGGRHRPKETPPSCGADLRRHEEKGDGKGGGKKFWAAPQDRRGRAAQADSAPFSRVKGRPLFGTLTQSDQLCCLLAPRISLVYERRARPFRSVWALAQRAPPDETCKLQPEGGNLCCRLAIPLDLRLQSGVAQNRIPTLGQTL